MAFYRISFSIVLLIISHTRHNTSQNMYIRTHIHLNKYSVFHHNGFFLLRKYRHTNHQRRITSQS